MIHHLSVENSIELSRRSERYLVWLIVLAHVVLAIGFGLGPMLEGPDEIGHYRYIQTLADTRKLLNPVEQRGGESHQAPLYYVLGVPVAMLVNDVDFRQYTGNWNPFHGYATGVPGNDNKNVHLHTRSEAFPYTESSTARGVHLARLISTALGAATVVASYAAFKEFWPDWPDRRLVALGLVAFLPNFIYMSSVVNNDTLLYTLATVSLLLLLRQERTGPSWRRALILGVVLGAALITKVSALFLVFPVGLATLMNRNTWRYAPLTLLVTLATAGWWYIRNLIQFGDPTLSQLFLQLNPEIATRGGKPAFDTLAARLPWAYRTFWAGNGSGRVAVGTEVYTFFNVLTVIALAGIMLQLIRYWKVRGSTSAITVRQISISAVFFLSWLAGMLYFASINWQGHQGRFVLPGIAALGILVAYGIDAWSPARFKIPVALGIVMLLATAASVTLLGYYVPAFKAQRPPSTIHNALALQFEDAAEIIGVEPALSHARPGETITIALYWRAIRPTNSSLLSFLHSVDSSAVQRDSYPATGNLLSTDWQAGQTWSENYIVRIPQDAESQQLHDLVAGLYDPAADRGLPATSEDGEEVIPVVGQIAIHGDEQPFEATFVFGDVVGMAEPVLTEAEDNLQVCLSWVSLAPTTQDYQIFVHALDANGQLATQIDLQPKAGQFPTSVWLPGETISECVRLDTSETQVDIEQVGIGLYELANGQRLSAHDTEGQVLIDNMVRAAP